MIRPNENLCSQIKRTFCAVNTISRLTGLEYWKTHVFDHRCLPVAIIENEDNLIEIIKRAILYADFITIIPPPQGRINTINNPQLLKGPPGIIYIEDNPSYLKFFISEIEKEREQIRKGCLGGIYYPFMFINYPKLSAETQVIINGPFKNHYDHFTLDQLYFLYITWMDDLRPIWTYSRMYEDIIFHEDNFLLHPNFWKYVKQAESLSGIPFSRSINLDKVPYFLSDLNINKNLIKSFIKKRRGMFEYFARYILADYYSVFREQVMSSSNLIEKYLKTMQHLNKPLPKPLLYLNLPFLERVSLKHLIKTRIREEDSFILFRKALFDAVQQLKQIYPHENAKKIAKRVKEDIILPELIKLNRQFKKIVTYRTFRMAIFTTVPLTLNFLLGNTAYEIAAKASYSIFSKTALEANELWKEMQEFKENQLYFLWKLKR